MSDTDDIVVEIEGEAGSTPAAETETNKQPDPVAELEAQLAERKAETERERAGREAERVRADQEAQRRAEAEKAVETARTEVTETRLSTIEQGLAAAQTASDAAKARYQTAMEAGDWAKAADAQVDIADARADLKRLTEAKADLEAVKTAPPIEKREVRVETTTERAADPVEAYLSQVARQFPESAKWLRNHPDDARVMATGSDPRRMAKINAAHQDAIAEGNAIDTPEYFAHVEKFLGMTKAAANGADKNATNGAGNGAQRQQTQRRAPAAPVAPVAQGGGAVNGGGVEVRLTKGEAERATDGTIVWLESDLKAGRIKDKSLVGAPIGHQEYARRKQKMQADGLYDKVYYEQ